MSVCRSCGAPIFWARNERTANLMPVDEHPHPDGNVEIVGEADGTPVVVVHGKGRGLPDLKSYYLSHFATCPQGQEWRKPKAGATK